MHLGCQRLVLDELKQVVLKDHRALTRGHVFPHLKYRLIGHGYVALLHVSPQVAETFGNAFALAVYGQLLCFGVECKEITGCRCVQPLLYGEAHPCLHFFRPFDRFSQREQCTGVHQMHGCSTLRGDVGLPRGRRKTAVTLRFIGSGCFI